MNQTSALILGDLQNDFLHPDGAYARGGQTSPAIAARSRRTPRRVLARGDCPVKCLAECFRVLVDVFL